MDLEILFGGMMETLLMGMMDPMMGFGDPFGGPGSLFGDPFGPSDPYAMSMSSEPAYFFDDPSLYLYEGYVAELEASGVSAESVLQATDQQFYGY